MTDWLQLLLPLALIAALYASVGHGGASGYLAVMALAGVAPEVMKPTALTLNLAVSLVGTVLFLGAGHFAWRLFWPFAAVSIPLAYLGGRLDAPAALFRGLVALALASAALRLALTAPAAADVRRPPIAGVLLAGSAIGLVSGLIGVGGGIFLTTLLLLSRWADPKTAAAVSAPFVFVNSAAALVGHAASLHRVPAELPWLVAAAVAGGFLGARWGSGIARPLHLRPALVAVLVVASVKLLIE
jgi:hypothetical protein